MSGLTEATPERLSVAAKETVTLALFQPFWFGFGVRVAVIFGGVRSMTRDTLVDAPTRPALGSPWKAKACSVTVLSG